MKLKNIRRSVRIVRTENAFTDRTNRTDRGKGLRIVKRVYGSWIKFFKNGNHRSWNFVSRFSHLARLNQPGVLHKQCVVLVENNFCNANCWRWIFSLKNVCDIVRRFVAVFCTRLIKSSHGIRCHRQWIHQVRYFEFRSAACKMMGV